MATIETAIPTLSLPLEPFRNEPFTDFTNPANVRRMQEALIAVRSQLGHEYDMVIGNRLVKTREKIKSVNPAHPSQIVGICQREHAPHQGLMKFCRRRVL